MNDAHENTALIELDTSIYDLTAIFKCCYLFTDNCYLFLARSENGKILVQMKLKDSASKDLPALKGEFLNELINQRVRKTINEETGKIRELLVAQAFSEGNLLNSSTNHSVDDYLTDPLGITEPDKV